jgi:hypothetical protein
MQMVRESEEMNDDAINQVDTPFNEDGQNRSELTSLIGLVVEARLIASAIHDSAKASNERGQSSVNKQNVLQLVRRSSGASILWLQK